MARQYEYRPAKAAQRRMIVDACRRLTAIAPLDEYQYVGFGGLEFIDFVEFHQALGIRHMTSIENDAEVQARQDLNVPYQGLRLLAGEARDCLPDIDWTRLSITWLDYTSRLTTNVLRDLNYAVRMSQPGSVVMVTVSSVANDRAANRLECLQEELANRIPDGLGEPELRGWGAASIERGVLQAEAHSAGRQAHQRPVRQLFNFQYADDAKMLTWGGVVSSINMDRTIDNCRFEDLHFVRSDEGPFDIKVPMFTPREIAFLEKQLVATHDTLPKVAGLRSSDIAAFAAMYRWRVGTK